MKNLKLLILVALIPVAGYFYSFLSRVDFVDYDSPVAHQKLENAGNRKILLVHTELGMGGAEVHEVNLYKGLIEKGYDVDLLVTKNSDLSMLCDEAGLPYYSSNVANFKVLKYFHQFFLSKQIASLAQKDSIVQTYNEKEAVAAKETSDKVIFTRHLSMPLKNPKNTLNGLAGVIAASSYIEDDLKSIGSKEHINISNIETIAPLFNEKRFTSFKTEENKKSFFKREFDVDLQDLPVVCMIANMPSDGNKNHQLLFHAVAKLINEVNVPVEVVIAGKGGSGRKKLESLARELKIDKYVHFLGFTNKVPDILYHSDMNILPSKKEAFGISLLEGALMKKPLIYSSGNGGDALVIHEKTGLLFKNGDENDLLAQIGRVLKDPAWAKGLGQNAYEHVKKNFTREVSLKKYQDFYNKI